MTKTSWTMRAAGVVAVSAVGILVGGQDATAGTNAQNFQVQATVTGACTLTAANLNFGNYTTGTVTAVNGSTAWTITCPGATAGAPVPVNLTMAPTGGTFAMANGGNLLNYSLCDDAACAQAYANNVARPNFNITTGVGQAYTLYGQIPAGQTPPTGAYVQDVTATLTF